MASNTLYGGKDGRAICRHFLAGRIEMPKLCLINHDCGPCAYDQWLDETGRTRRRSPVAAVTSGEVPAVRAA